MKKYKVIYYVDIIIVILSFFLTILNNFPQSGVSALTALGNFVVFAGIFIISLIIFIILTIYFIFKK